jgi:hypothetical protein
VFSQVVADAFGAGGCARGIDALIEENHTMANTNFKRYARHYGYTESGWQKAIDDYAQFVSQSLGSTDESERLEMRIKAAFALACAFTIERALKRNRLIEATPEEQTAFKLDIVYGCPDDRKPREFQGKLYICKRIPLLWHPVTKQVLFWDRLWICISEADGRTLAAYLSAQPIA